MAVSAYKRGVNYAATYLLLVKDFVSFLGWKSIFIIGAVVLAGLLYPLPFAVMATAVYAVMAGHKTGAANLLGWRIQLNDDSLFLYALVFAGVTLTLQYLATRIALTSTSAWQTSLYWRAVNQLPRIARWDLEMAVPMPIALARAGTFLNAIVRSGFLIGRILMIGLSNFVIVLGGIVVLAWLDLANVAILIIIAMLFLPVYAWAMLRLIGNKQRNLRTLREQKSLAQGVLEEVSSDTGRQVDTNTMSKVDMSRFEAGYGTVNTQLQGLNLVMFISGVLVFFSIGMIYLINGASLAAFLRDKILFFVVLIFVMRSALALATLMARLSRNYSNLATLRAYLHPRRKRLKPFKAAPDNAVFALQSADDGSRHPLCTGAPVFVVMPGASRAYELLPLSNALEIVNAPAPGVLPYIVFIDTAEHPAIFGHDGAQSATTSVIRVPHGKQDLELPVLHTKSEPDKLGIVALTYEAWKFLVDSGRANEYCRDRIVFVVIAEPKRPQPPSSTTLLVVSDCVDILAVGSFADTWDTQANRAFERASKNRVSTDLEKEEDEEI